MMVRWVDIGLSNNKGVPFLLKKFINGLDSSLSFGANVLDQIITGVAAQIFSGWKNQGTS